MSILTAFQMILTAILPHKAISPVESMNSGSFPENKSAKSIFRRYVSESSFHGVELVARAETKMEKSFWIILLGICLGAFLYFSVLLFETYKTKATVSTVSPTASVKYPNLQVDIES